jgi:hypothetical protein
MKIQESKKAIMHLCETFIDFNNSKKQNPEQFNTLANELISVLEKIDKELGSNKKNS